MACLFHEDRIRKRCSIVTDLDRSIMGTLPESTDDEADERRKEKFQNPRNEDWLGRMIWIEHSAEIPG